MNTIRQKLAAYRWRWSAATSRAARGIRYATGRATQSDALTMLYEVENIAGHYALESISAESALNDALDIYEPHPALERLCERAAARVAHKWSSSGDVTAAALDWALELVADYATDEGAELIEIGESTGTEIKHAMAQDEESAR